MNINQAKVAITGHRMSGRFTGKNFLISLPLSKYHLIISLFSSPSQYSCPSIGLPSVSLSLSISSTRLSIHLSVRLSVSLFVCFSFSPRLFCRFIHLSLTLSACIFKLIYLELIPNCFISSLNGCYGLPLVHYKGRQGDYYILVCQNFFTHKYKPKK